MTPTLDPRTSERSPCRTPSSGRGRLPFAVPAVLALALLLLAAGFASPARAQEEPAEEETSAPIYADSLTHLEDWGSYAVSVANQRLYFGSGNRLVIADASDPSQPREVSRLSMPYLVRDVHVTGEYAYVADDAGGLRIVDVTDPVEPTEIASVAFADRVDAVDVEGNHAYVAARSDGVHVLDVSSPETPEKVGHFQTDEQAAGVTVRDTILHVAATYGGHRILDVSDPTRPEEIGFAVRGSYDQGYSWDVAVAGTTAYVANVEIGLRRVDVSDPAESAPTLDIQQTVHYTNDSRYRYEILDRPAAVEVFNDFAYVADQNSGLRILDLSDPDTMRIVGTADTPGRALDVAVSGNTAFVADQYAGVRVIDVSDPFAPTEIGFWDEDQHAVRLSLSDGVVRMADRQNGLWTLDPSSPSDPTPTSFYHFPELSTFAAEESRTVVGSAKGVLRVLENSSSGETRVAGEIEFSVPVEDVRLRERYAYVAVRERGIRVVDLADPARPTVVGTYAPERVRTSETEFRYYPDPPSAWALTVDGTTAYASFDDGIHVLDLSEPSAPRRVGRFGHSERAMQTVLRGDHLYAAFDDGLRILDVSDPAAPRQTGYVDTPSYARDVALDESHAYVADLTGGLLVVDVSDPANPQTRATIAIERGRLVDVAYDGEGHVYAAATTAGLRVIDVADPEAPRLLTSN